MGVFLSCLIIYLCFLLFKHVFLFDSSVSMGLGKTKTKQRTYELVKL